MKKYKGYTNRNLSSIPQLETLDQTTIDDMRVVAEILPFKTNEYLIDNVINWENVPDDPIFRLTFPQKNMLLPHHFELMQNTLMNTSNNKEIGEVANSIRTQLNPHPAGQLNYNLAKLNGEILPGLQHKYRETVLFFPQHGQTCHAYCTFCFRWPQFTKLNDSKMAMNEVNLLVEYLELHPEVSDVLFTGGDPMIMNGNNLNRYFRPLIEKDIPSLKTIRIGSKSLSYWPSKYVNASETEAVLSLFSDITQSGINLSFMAHFNHYQELETDILREAVKNILTTGAQIRTQSPILNWINASADIWAKMWRKQVDLGMIPYYMFVVRDTGAQHYFNIYLSKAWEIYTEAYSKVSGICRTVRGPSMSTTPGKIEISGISEIMREKVFILRFIQGRNPDWVNRPFFAKYNEKAIWLDDLQPISNESHFFFEKELESFLHPYGELELTMLSNEPVGAKFIGSNYGDDDEISGQAMDYSLDP
jgi:KamA family protein